MNPPLASQPATPPSAPGVNAVAVTKAAPSGRQHRFWHALLVVIMLEVGLLLLILPWSRNWNSNFWALRWPALWRYWVNPYLRGAISGLGLLNLWFGTEEIVPHAGETRH